MNYGGGRFSRKKLDPALTVSFLLWYACLEKEKKRRKQFCDASSVLIYLSIEVLTQLRFWQLTQPPVFLNDDPSSAHLNEIIIIAFWNFYLKTNSSKKRPDTIDPTANGQTLHRLIKDISRAKEHHKPMLCLFCANLWSELSCIWWQANNPQHSAAL